MARFVYTAFFASGKPAKGEIEAISKKEALQQLSSKGYLVYHIEEKTNTPASSKSSSSGASNTFPKNPFGGYRKLALNFLKRLLQLNASGIPIGDTIKILQQRITHPKQKIIATSLWRDLSEGVSLSTAMRKFPHVFTDSMTFPIEAGEATGNLTPVFKEVVAYLENQEDLKKRIIAGLSYPIFVSTMALGVVALFLFFLLPRIQGMMSTLGGEMNLSAKILIGSAEWLIKGGPFMLGGLSVCLLVLSRWYKTVGGRNVLDRWMLKIPFFGTIFYQIDLCQVSNLLSTLLNSGINVTEAMKLVEKAIKNTTLKHQFQSARIHINDGMAFASAFKHEIGFFSDIALDILAVGENTGQLEKCFSEIYSLYQTDLDQNFKRLTNVISGFALLFAFALVGILALSIVMSILQFSNTLIAN